MEAVMYTMGLLVFGIVIILAIISLLTRDKN